MMAGIVRRFARSTRAGATSLVALVVTIVALGSGALATDYLWLLNQRDLLKHAANAAAIASTQELQTILADHSEDEIIEQLESLARRYVVYNFAQLSPSRRVTAKETLVVTATLPTPREVRLTIEANLGGLLFLHRIPLFNIDPDTASRFRVQSGVELSVRPVELVIAIDSSSSMLNTLEGAVPGLGEPSRMDVVRAAALNLVEILEPSAGTRVAVGIVPWEGKVRLDPATLSLWSARTWARYPRARHYPVTYRCPFLDLDRCSAPEAVDPLPSNPMVGAWRGCLDEHRLYAGLARNPDPADRIAPPSIRRFATALFPAPLGFRYRCIERPYPTDMASQRCYTTRTGTLTHPNAPQLGCALSSLQPLTHDVRTLETRIGTLAANGRHTYSALGVQWAHRMLSPAWAGIWGHPEHPADPDAPGNEGLKKALVLLTDGEDTYCGVGNVSCESSTVGLSRSRACAAARADGILVFVIAAMPPFRIASGFGRDLEECSSAADDPSGRYVFLQNASPADLEAAFASVAQQLISVRRTR